MSNDRVRRGLRGALWASIGAWLALGIGLRVGDRVEAQSPSAPADQTGTIYDGMTPLVPKFAVVDAASSGDNTIVAAVTGKKIRVLAGSLTMTGTLVTIRWESGAGGTALTGQMQPLAGHTITMPYSPVGHFQTAASTLLNLELGGAQSVDGWIVYVEVD